MKRRPQERTPDQKAEIAQFVARLFDASGQPSQRQFAIKAGVVEASLSDWLGAKGSPDGYNMLRLIRAAAGDGEASPEVATSALPTNGTAARLHLEALEAGIASNTRSIDLLGQSIEDLRSEIEQLRSELRPPERKRQRRGP